MTFSENLNRICKERGTTVSSILKEFGLSTSKVTMWNNGSLPKQEMLLRLADRLDCSVMDFFQDDKPRIMVADIDIPTQHLRVNSSHIRTGRHLKRALPHKKPSISETTPDLNEDEQEIIRFFRDLSLKEKHIFMARMYAYENGEIPRKE